MHGYTVQRSQSGPRWAMDGQLPSGERKPSPGRALTSASLAALVEALSNLTGVQVRLLGLDIDKDRDSNDQTGLQPAL
jgi:hypothetical protein